MPGRFFAIATSQKCKNVGNRAMAEASPRKCLTECNLTKKSVQFLIQAKMNWLYGAYHDYERSDILCSVWVWILLFQAWKKTFK